MSTKEEKIILSVETARSAQSVSDLQKILKAAKDELIAAKEGSEQYKKALEVAAVATDKLAVSNEKIKGSLPSGSIRALRGELMEAKNAMLQAEEGSAEYAAALKRAADASFQMREMNEEIKNSAGDVGEALGNTTKVMGGLLQGATAVTAGMQLFGIENESVVEGIARLQQISAIAQGVQGMEGLGKSMKALSLNIKGMTAGTKLAAAAQKAWNLVMAANPIMLMVTAIAALVAGLVVLFSWMKKNNEEQEERNRLMNDYIILSEEMRIQDEFALRMARAKGASEEELFALKKKNIQVEMEFNRQEMKRLSGIRDRSDEEQKLLEETVAKSITLAEQLQKNDMDYAVWQAEQAKKQEDEKEKARQKEIEDQKAKNQKLRDEQLAADKKAKEEAEKLRQDELKAIDAINEAIRQKQLSELDKLAEKYQAEKALFEKHQKDVTQLTADYEQQRSDILAAMQQAEHERQMESMRQRNEATLANIDEYWMQVSIRDTEARTNGEITEREFNSRQYASNIAHLESLLESQTLSADQELQVTMQLAQAKKQIADAELQHRRGIVSAIGALADVAADIAGRETAAGKGLAIAAATISTWQAAQQGYLSAFLPVPTVASPALGALNVATALAVGFKNIKQIVNTKVPGRAGGGGGAPSGGGGTPTVPSAPRVPSAPNIPQALQPTRNVQTQTEIDLQRQPLRAYVVETELRGVQDRAQRTEAETTI